MAGQGWPPDNFQEGKEVDYAVIAALVIVAAVGAWRMYRYVDPGSWNDLS